MIKYTIEEVDNSSNIFLIDEEHSIKEFVAVVFDITHARIIVRKLNEYVRGNKAKESID